MLYNPLVDFVIGNFIFQNYRQALEKISTNTQQLEALENTLKTGPADYDRFLEEERQYFISRKSEPPEVYQTVEYMELLLKLRNTEYTISFIPFP